MTKNYVYFIPCNCGNVYKDKTFRPLKVRLEEHRKAVVQGEISNLGMADYIWKKKATALIG